MSETSNPSVQNNKAGADGTGFRGKKRAVFSIGVGTHSKISTNHTQLSTNSIHTRLYRKMQQAGNKTPQQWGTALFHKGMQKKKVAAKEIKDDRENINKKNSDLHALAPFNVPSTATMPEPLAKRKLIASLFFMLYQNAFDACRTSLARNTEPPVVARRRIRQRSSNYISNYATRNHRQETEKSS